MKGLLIKDFRLLISQKAYYLVILLVAMSLLITQGNSEFVMGYLYFLCMMFVINSISYDEADNGYAFLFCMPVDRKSYVREKYVFSLCLGAVSWLVAFGVSAAASLALSQNPDLKNLLVIGAFFVLIFQLFAVIVIPIQLKFSNEKGRIAMIMVWFGGFGLLYLGYKVTEILKIDVAGTFGRLLETEPQTVLLGTALIATVLMLVSMRIAERIMVRREF